MNYVISLVTIAFFGIIILRTLHLSFSGEDRSAVVAFWVGLCWRICIAMLMHFVLAGVNYQSKGGLYFDDEWFYLKMGLIGENVLGSSGSFFQSPAGNQAYVNLLGILFFVWGTDILLIRFWMALIGAAVVPVTYCLAKSIYGSSNIARTSAWAVAFFPPLVVHSVVLIREIIMTLFLTASAYFAATWQRSRFSKIGVVVSILMLFYFRKSLGLISMAIFVSSGFVGKMENRRQYLGLVGIIIFSYCFFDNISSIDRLKDFWEEITSRMVTVDESRIGQAAEGRVGSSLGLEEGEVSERSVFLGLRSLLQPTPIAALMQEFPQNIIQCSEGVAWYAVFPFVILGGARLFARGNLGKTLWIWIMPVLVFVYLSTPWGAGQEALRARVDILPFLLIMGSYGFFEYRYKRGLGNLRHVPGFVAVVLVMVTAVYGLASIFDLTITDWKIFGLLILFVLLGYAIERLRK